MAAGQRLRSERVSSLGTAKWSNLCDWRVWHIRVDLDGDYTLELVWFLGDESPRKVGLKVSGFLHPFLGPLWTEPNWIQKEHEDLCQYTLQGLMASIQWCKPLSFVTKGSKVGYFWVTFWPLVNLMTELERQRQQQTLGSSGHIQKPSFSKSWWKSDHYSGFYT